MRIIFNFLFALFLSICSIEVCHGDLLITKSAQKIFGLIIENQQDRDSVQFAVCNRANAEFQIQRFERNNFQSLTRTIDQKQLANLDFSNLDSVRNAAEDLAGIPNDIACKQIAKRLFLLVVYHGNLRAGSIQLIDSACRNLAKLANSTEEEQLFARIGLVYGSPELVAPKQTLGSTTKQNPEDVRRLVRLLRQEEFPSAAKLFEQLETKVELSQQVSELARAILSSRQVDNSNLKSLLQVELKSLEPNFKIRDSSQSIDDRFKIQRPGLLKLEEALDFDLESTRLLNGKWVKPGQVTK